MYFDEKKAILPQQSSQNAGWKGVAWDMMLDLVTEFIWSGGRISGEIKEILPVAAIQKVRPSRNMLWESE